MLIKFNFRLPTFHIKYLKLILYESYIILFYYIVTYFITFFNFIVLFIVLLFIMVNHPYMLTLHFDNTYLLFFMSTFLIGLIAMHTMINFDSFLIKGEYFILSVLSFFILYYIHILIFALGSNKILNKVGVLYKLLIYLIFPY